MARRIDDSGRRVHRSFGGTKPVRPVAMLWNPSRYRSQALEALMKCLRRLSASRA